MIRIKIKNKKLNGGCLFYIIITYEDKMHGTSKSYLMLNATRLKW